MNEEMIEVTVKVPRSKLARLYESVAKLNGDEPAQESGKEEGEFSDWTNEDVALAAEHWAKLSEDAQQMYELLMSAPGKKFSGDEIAKKLKLTNGAFGTAGLLAWPWRYASKAGRKHPISRETLSNNTSQYWMEEGVAFLFEKTNPWNEEALSSKGTPAPELEAACSLYKSTPIHKETPIQSIGQGAAQIYPAAWRVLPELPLARYGLCFVETKRQGRHPAKRVYLFVNRDTLDASPWLEDELKKWEGGEWSLNLSTGNPNGAQLLLKLRRDATMQEATNALLDLISKTREKINEAIEATKKTKLEPKKAKAK